MVPCRGTVPRRWESEEPLGRLLSRPMVVEGAEVVPDRQGRRPPARRPPEDGGEEVYPGDYLAV